MNFAKIKRDVLGFLGIESAPIANGKSNFTETQIAEMKRVFGEKTEGIIAAFDEEAAQTQTATAQQTLIDTTAQELAAERAAREAAEKRAKEAELAVEVLSAMAETDPAATVQATMPQAPKVPKQVAVIENRAYNKVDASRPWNKRMEAFVFGSEKDRKMALAEIQAAGYTENNINQIIADLGEYSRQDLGFIISFFGDDRQLPKHWRTLSNVNDQAIIPMLFTSEVTQTRKDPFLPKGSATWEPEIVQMYAIQIDILIKGSQLQEMEQSWLYNALEMVRRGGSGWQKMSYVQFIVQELLKRAAQEQQIAAINGVYAPTSATATVAGRAENIMNGVRKLLSKRIADRKIVPFNIGAPVIGGLLEYVDKMVMGIPEERRNRAGLVYYIPYNHYKSYIEEYESTKGTYPSYVPGEDWARVWGHSNIRFEPLAFMGDSQRHFITHEENIVLCENIPGEGAIQLGYELKARSIEGVADWKASVAFRATGKIKAVGEEDFVEQAVWCNKVDDLLDIFVDADANDTTPSVKYHQSLRLPANTGATAITNIDDAVTGDIITLLGTSATNSSTIANSGNFVLTAAWTAGVNLYIKLVKRSDGKFVEIARGSYVEELMGGVTLAADATTINATNGNVFYTNANTVATSIASISNATAGEYYKIVGAGGTTNASTMTTSNFPKIASNMTFTDGAWIELLYNGSAFIEVQRSA